MNTNVLLESGNEVKTLLAPPDPSLRIDFILDIIFVVYIRSMKLVLIAQRISYVLHSYQTLGSQFN